MGGILPPQNKIMLNNVKQIWLKTKTINQYAEIMHEFMLADRITHAYIELYSDTEYVLYINDTFIGTGQFKSFENDRVYDTYDISSILSIGNNTLRIIAYTQGESTGTYAATDPGVAYSINLDGRYIYSGEDSLIREYSHYKSGSMPKISPQLGFTFEYDATQAPSVWDSADISCKEYNLIPRPIEKLEIKPLIQADVYSQGTLIRKADGTPAELMQSDYLSYRESDNDKVYDNDSYIVFDLGREYAGFFNMDIIASEGTTLDISYGEHLDDMRVRSSVGGRSFAFRYTAKEGIQDFTSYFRRIAARYIEIHITNAASPVNLKSVGIIPTDYPLQHESEFWVNDYFYNKLIENSKNTLKLCMHEHYEDCPWREQGLYVFDSMIQMLCGYYAFGEYKFPRASLELLAKGQQDDGMLEICAPGRSNITIPSFSLCFIISLQKYLLYSGDLDFGRVMLPVCHRIISAFEIKDNIVYRNPDKKYWHFYEWTDNLDGYVPHDTDALINFYYIASCEALNLIYSYLGMDEHIDTAEMKTAVHDKFYSQNKKLYKSFFDSEQYHELTQCLALVSGVSNDKYIVDVLASGKSDMVEISLSTSIFKFDALLQYDISYLDTMLDYIASRWGRMAYSDTSTLWETDIGGADFDRAGSLCHGWSAVPLYVLYRYVLNFYPTSPGFKTYELSPNKTTYINNIKSNVKLSDNSIIQYKA